MNSSRLTPPFGGVKQPELVVRRELEKVRMNQQGKLAANGTRTILATIDQMPGARDQI